MDMLQALQVAEDPAWLLIEEGYDPLRESSAESRFTVSNGFLGVRGSRSVSRGPTWVSWLPTLRWASWPRTYVAGLFDTPNIEPAVPALVPLADWLRMRVLVDGVALVQHSGHMLQHQRILDLRRGAMITVWRQRDPSGIVVKITTLRVVSQADRRLGLQLVRVEVEDGATPEISLDVRFGQMGGGLDADRLEQDLGVWRTEQSGKSVAVACAVALQVDGTELSPRAPSPFRWSWHWTAQPGLAASFQRLIAVARSDHPGADPSDEALHALDRAKQLGWRSVLAQHEAAWERRWLLSDLAIEGDDAACRALRFAIYHLNSAVNPADEKVSIGARALTGDAYLGHVFWDTEIYLLPFYIATWPEAARALLMYRWHTLPGARAKAANMGLRGAMYAWESTDTGEETTPEQVIGPRGKVIPILCGTQEQHITADIAYAVWQYWQATGDDDFMLDAGAEILLDTARFWAGRAALEADGRYHIRGVIGPDEYHETIDDNAYTNVMARWNIMRGIEIAATLRERWPDRWLALSWKLQLDASEASGWIGVADAMFTGFAADSGLFEQFVGFFDLEDVDLSQYADRTVPIDVVFGRERTQRSQVVKQADVVALLALLPEACGAPDRLVNFRYYERRCGHGSSLSRGVHALVAARLGETETAVRYFRETATTDLADTADGSAGGVHIAALGGLWQAAVFGFGGVSLCSEALGIDPHLPADWKSLGCCVHWRGRRVTIKIDAEACHVSVVLTAGDAMPVRVQGERHVLEPGTMLRCDLQT